MADVYFSGANCPNDKCNGTYKWDWCQDTYMNMTNGNWCIEETDADAEDFKFFKCNMCGVELGEQNLESGKVTNCTEWAGIRWDLAEYSRP